MEVPGRLSFAPSLKAARAVADGWAAQDAPGGVGGWNVRYDTDAPPDGIGRLFVEDDKGSVVAEVPFGGDGRLGFVAAERLARQIAALPGK